MTIALYLPPDSLTGSPPDFNPAADFLELSAFFAETRSASVLEIKNTIDIGAPEEPDDVDDEMRTGSEEVVSGTANLIETRGSALGPAYPYKLDSCGDMLECMWEGNSLGQTAYIVCLLLSNLQPISPILGGSHVHPDRADTSRLREYFQYFATAALAAETGGNSWSFGFPRPDHSPFLAKLEEIWRRIGDGYVEAQVGAPTQPKDDQVDVFAARSHPDQLPGCLLAAAQVATGRNWKAKSLKGRLGAFKSRWFRKQPVTDLLPYMIIPFARTDEEFIDDVRTMGNVLHRLRVPRRVEEAEQLLRAGITIEAYDRLEGAVQWVTAYRGRTGAAT